MLCRAGLVPLVTLRSCNVQAFMTKAWIDVGYLLEGNAEKSKDHSGRQARNGVPRAAKCVLNVRLVRKCTAANAVNANDELWSDNYHCHDC